MTRKLDPKDRSALRDLLLGVVEHCEISRHLIGTMIHTFYRDGVKYGIPGFTFVGPAGARNQQARIGIVAGKQPGDRLSAEVTLELLERLLLQPSIAGNTTLRIVPILNPEGLEKPDSNAVYHALTEERIRLQSPEGMIEIASIDDPALHFTMHGDATAQKALELASDDLHRLSSEINVRLSQTLITVDPKQPGAHTDGKHGGSANGDAAGKSANEENDNAPAAWIFPSLLTPSPEPWELHLGIPRGWGANVSVQVAGQFLLSFLRHLERLESERQLSDGAAAAATKPFGGGYGLSNAYRSAYRH